VVQTIISLVLGVAVGIISLFGNLILTRRLSWQVFLLYFVWSLGFCLVAFGLVDGVILAIPHVVRGYLALLGVLGVEVSQTIIGGMLVAMGYGAYFFKRAKQRWYGLVEILFTFVTVVVALKTTKHNPLGLATALIGAMYVGSRGFSNYVEGRRRVQSQMTT